MKIVQEFIVTRPLSVVWEFFHDIPKIAECLPGAEYQGVTQAGKHAGKVSTRIGPFQTSFEGEADVRYDDSSNTINFEGKGVDRRGASRGQMTMTCLLVPIDNATKVLVDAEVQHSGAIAQFRPDGSYRRNCESPHFGFCAERRD